MNGTQHPASETPSPAEGHHGFVQAPVRPLDEDGTTATLVGTALFTIAAVVMSCLGSRLDARGDGWWLWVCVVGALLGLIGYAYCRRRAASLR